MFIDKNTNKRAHLSGEPLGLQQKMILGKCILK